MATFGLWTILLIACVFKLSGATVRFEFWAKKFSSDCSEGTGYTCDFMFTFCFDKPHGTPTFSVCHYKKTIESDYWYGESDITFTSDIKGIPNPIAFDMNNFEERKVRLLVRLRDSDLHGVVTYILTMKRDISFTPASNSSTASWKSYTFTDYKNNEFFRLSCSYRAYCNPNYYGPDCTVYCKPRTGLYTCTSDGQKNCVLGNGWQGDNCDEDVDECETTPDICSLSSSNITHYVCNNTIGSYECVCAPGWKGSNCDEDVDECQGVASLPCLNGGNCTGGSNRCICPNTSNGSTCSGDVDGCVNVTSPCPPDQPRCVNVIGGYNCFDKGAQNKLSEEDEDEDEDTFLWWPIVVAVVVVVAVAGGIAGFVLIRRKQRNPRSTGGSSLPSATDVNNSNNVYYTANATDNSYCNFEAPEYSSLYEQK